MAEEDLIFAKNRHMFGGIEPSNMRKFSASSMYDFKNNRSTITIMVTLPLDTIVENQTLCTVAGAVIRRKTTGYPVDEFDGDMIADVTSDTTILDADVISGTTYYYSAFPYSDLRVFNRNISNRTSVIAKNDTYIFGFDIDIGDPNPSTRVIYPSDTDNAEYSPARMNYTGLAFNYGDWPSEAGIMFMPKPCMLNNDGTVYEYLNPDDYSKNVDGGASKVSDASFNGNAMMEWPKIYIKRGTKVVGSDTYYTFRCSNKKVGNDWDCWCNYDINNNEIDHFYTAIYPGSVVNGMIRSLSGKNGAIELATISKQVDMAKLNGSDWIVDTFSDHLLIYDLLVMLSKSTNLKECFGYGKFKQFNTQDITSYTFGQMNNKGLFWGSNTDEVPVKAFGMECLWGYQDRYIIGFGVDAVFKEGTQISILRYRGKLTRGTHDGTPITDYPLHPDRFDTNYLFLGYAIEDNDAGYWGYGNVFGVDNNNRICCRLPGKPFNGSATIYDCSDWYLDMLYVNDSPYTKYGGDGFVRDSGAYGGFMEVDQIRARAITKSEKDKTFVALSCKPSLT